MDVNCVRFLRCTISITRSVSRAWCGRNSLMRWCMWMNSRFMSSIFSSLFGDSGHFIRISIRSRKFTNTEWFNFLSSFFLSISFAE